MLNYPCGSSLQQAQPLVLKDEEVFVKTRRRRGVAALVTALGVAHPLRRLCSFKTLIEHSRRLNGPSVRHLLKTEFHRQSAAGCTDALRYVVDHLAPSFSERDWNESYQEIAGLHSQSVPPVDLAAEIAGIAEAIPGPDLPSPTLWLLGRAWVLEANPEATSSLHVRWGNGVILGLTGAYALASTLARQWENAVQGFVARSAAQLADDIQNVPTGSALQKAREELSRTGFWQSADLLFLPGPRLGYILRPHYNRILQRESIRDLAMTAPLELPPRISFPSIYLRSAGGRWAPFQPPHGLCLGGDPPSVRPADPGLALAAYLRWAALRVAANGKFHASDD